MPATCLGTRFEFHPSAHAEVARLAKWRVQHFPMSVPALQVTVDEACALVVGSWESAQGCEASQTPGAVCIARDFRRVGHGSGGNGIQGRSQPTD